nr:immunoglobulin light chain junction region [Macaca mulatta]MOW29253.1 immunoglobulin light chain junction region [Macaca mulatta]MOW29841.1 immunoglobulin light chain junction region [Macaca mulatta]
DYYCGAWDTSLSARVF